MVLDARSVKVLADVALVLEKGLLPNPLSPLVELVVPLGYILEANTFPLFDRFFTWLWLLLSVLLEYTGVVLWIYSLTKCTLVVEGWFELLTYADDEAMWLDAGILDLDVGSKSVG